MRRRALLAFSVAVLAGLAAALVAAKLDQRDLVAAFPARAGGTGSVIGPGEEACERPVHAPSNVNAVRFPPVTGHRPGPPIEVRLRAEPSGAIVAAGRLAPGHRASGYPDRPARTVRVAPVFRGGAILVCLRNAGPGPFAVYAGIGQRRRLDHGVSLAIVRERPVPLIETPGEVFERAALFRPRWVGAWVFWCLLGAVGVIVPTLLGWAVHAAHRGPHDGDDGAPAAVR